MDRTWLLVFVTGLLFLAIVVFIGMIATRRVRERALQAPDVSVEKSAKGTGRDVLLEMISMFFR